MKKRFGTCLLTALITLTVASASADLLFYDGFEYTAGELLAPSNDTTGSPNPGQHNVAYNEDWRYAGGGLANQNAPGIASVGLTAPGTLPAVGNSVLFDTTQLGSARIRVSPTSINSGTVYWSGLLQVSSIGTLTTGVNGMMLGGFNNSVGPGTLPTAVGAVLRIRQDSSDSTVYHIGTGMNSGTATGTSPNVQFDNTTPYHVNDTVFVVASYEFVSGTQNDIARMWINPDVSTFGNASPPSPGLTSAPGAGVNDSFTSLVSFNLRDVNTVGAPTVLFDELRVGNTWADVTTVPEPTAAGLVGLGMLLVTGWRLSRRH
jgi:hypothetical protein